MKILCIDTSSNLCSVAILDDSVLLEKIELNNGLTHSETLMPIINKILLSNHLNLQDINLIVVDIGPGSFTGIRIGVATAKAFSDSLNIPCIGISSLEVLAYNAQDDGIVCSSIDCKNNNSYFAVYSKENTSLHILIEPKCLSNSEIMSLLNKDFSESNIQFVGNGVSNVVSDNYLNVHFLGIAGLNKYNSNNQKSENILPLYIKKPQAQILLEKKEKGL